MKSITKIFEKKTFIILSLIFACFTTSSCSFFSNIPKTPEQIDSSELNFNPPEITKWDYPNGFKVVYFKHSEVPLVTASIISNCGNLCNTPTNPAMPAAAISLMRDGGTIKMSPDILDKTLDDLGASIQASQDETSTSVSMNSMKEDLDQVFNIFTDVINAPAYDEGRFNLWKSLTLDSISKRIESNDVLSKYSFAYLSFKNQYPWYMPVTSADLKTLSLKSIKDYQANIFSPSTSTLIIVGDLTLDKAKELSNSYYESTKNKVFKPIENNIKEGRISYPAGIYVLNKPFEQASIQMGYLTPKREKIDPYHELLFNRIFGASGFSSLLFKEIREKRGLAYDASGMVSTMPYGGEFNIELGTKSDKALKSVDGIYSLVNSIITDGFKKDDFIDSRRSAVQSFVFKFSEPNYLAVRDTVLKLKGMPSDWDKTFIEKIKNVNFDDVNKFSKNILTPENFITVIVGKVTPEEVKKEFPNIKVCELEFNEVPKISKCID